MVDFAAWLGRFPLTRNRHDRVCPGHLDAEGTAFQQTTLGIARALLIEITGTSPVMTSVGASISSEHALAAVLALRIDRPAKVVEFFK
jgi:hypothetical protein